VNVSKWHRPDSTGGTTDCKARDRRFTFATFEE
jgi:hypothetical protein